ncbi:MAG: DNA (cytosine-5-)-methyltransferase [Candidatus Moranbacteria bacterium RIFOXYB1_FULL_43_19]|nr:MAG: DNA (cytosine-5-)-methyltransferase [Candidatus Moranbacteria bacterium RIFOXYA1_FULL_44_7]OGI27338.1 MAG: DNA (cytosine-5-)-methyltransferase [Candidatus Moranbacteria bacterium RIFOXYB1_FULL_43_19]OGI33842.1 MAG: DNA (cytosine-5-)-methyltransferase [Candidatus Moranbacteria bacterium RIFOXYC1_FULL_44_13]OGI38789.1 MAG: DNA (cytosine-5-)-methyltransferase [Candidatus Moranbacteria bacterium RIFOXYD1_FULL_44_12]
MQKLLTISDAASQIGVSTDTIRRWDKKGLIKVQRSEFNYRVFNIDEIKKIHSKVIGGSSANNYEILKSNKVSEHTTIELFAGAGGTAIGFENAGLQHVLLNELDKNAVETLKQNRPKWNVIGGDIANIDFGRIKADIVQGGFPCQTFSYAGKKMGFEDVRGTMFFEFARCVKQVRPKIAVGENVRGLLRHDNGKTLETMVKIMEDLGYRVQYRVVRSQYLDVPQKRERLIIVALRSDIKSPFLFPKERDYTISIREALKRCPKSAGQEYPKKKKEILSIIPPGGYWRDLPIKLQKEYMGASFYMGGGKTGMARRLSWDEPSLTLTCSPAQKQTERCHPEETRPLSVREYARIQTFPDNWNFYGSVASQYRQIGNAVPCNLGYHIGKCLIAMLENKPDLETMDIAYPDRQSKLF